MLGKQCDLHRPQDRNILDSDWDESMTGLRRFTQLSKRVDKSSESDSDDWFPNEPSKVNGKNTKTTLNGFAYFSADRVDSVANEYADPAKIATSNIPMLRGLAIAAASQKSFPMLLHLLQRLHEVGYSDMDTAIMRVECQNFFCGEYEDGLNEIRDFALRNRAFSSKVFNMWLAALLGEGRGLAAILLYYVRFCQATAKAPKNVASRMRLVQSFVEEIVNLLERDDTPRDTKSNVTAAILQRIRDGYKNIDGIADRERFYAEARCDNVIIWFYLRIGEIMKARHVIQRVTNDMYRWSTGTQPNVCVLYGNISENLARIMLSWGRCEEASKSADVALFMYTKAVHIHEWLRNHLKRRVQKLMSDISNVNQDTTHT